MGFKDAAVALGVLEIGIEVKGFIAARGHHVLLAKDDLIQLARGQIGAQFALVAQVDVRKGRLRSAAQGLANMLRTARHIAVSGDTDDHGTELGRQAAAGVEVCAHRGERALSIGEACVAVGRLEGSQCGFIPFYRKALAQGPQRVKHAGEPGVIAKEHQAAPRIVGDFFVVDQGAAQIHHAAEKGHIIGLRFDGMGKTQIRLAVAKLGERDFFDPYDEVGAAQVFADVGTCVAVFFIGEYANGRWLQKHLQAVLFDQGADIVWSERRAPFPWAFFFAPNRQYLHDSSPDYSLDEVDELGLELRFGPGLPRLLSISLHFSPLAQQVIVLGSVQTGVLTMSRNPTFWVSQSTLESDVELVASSAECTFFPPHLHSKLELICVMEGSAGLEVPGHNWVLQAGDIAVLPPNVLHSCGQSQGRFGFLGVLLAAERLLEGPVDPRSSAPAVPVPAAPHLAAMRAPTIVRDPELARRARDFHHALVDKDKAAEVEQSGLRQLLWSLVLGVDARMAVPDHEVLINTTVDDTVATPAANATASGLRGPRDDGGFAADRIQFACRALSRIEDEPSLDGVARTLGLHKRYFISIFGRAAGITPQRYIIAHRVDRARQLLTEGSSLVNAAIDAGFADQSHLTRHFRRNYGVPPGRFQRCLTLL